LLVCFFNLSLPPMPSRLLHALRTPRGWLALAAAGVGSLAVLAGCSGLSEKERELVFRIEPGTASWYGGLPEGVEEIDLPVPKAIAHRGSPSAAAGPIVHAWWWPAEAADAPAVLYLHGSRWNLTGQLFRIEELHDLGFSVFAIDYRGFGKSRLDDQGDLPSEKTVYEDARVGWDAFVARVPDASRRYIYGHSLGGAIAVDLAASLSEAATKARAPSPAAGLVVESSFTNLADIARALSVQWLPIQLILSQKFDAVDKIAEVRMPVLVLHGDHDRYVPVGLGRKLYDAAPEPKRLVVVPGGTHNNSLRVGEDDVRRAFLELFELKMPDG